jgi:hypothetical protein
MNEKRLNTYDTYQTLATYRNWNYKKKCMLYLFDAMQYWWMLSWRMNVYIVVFNGWRNISVVAMDNVFSLGNLTSESVAQFNAWSVIINENEHHHEARGDSSVPGDVCHDRICWSVGMSAREKRCAHCMQRHGGAVSTVKCRQVFPRAELHAFTLGYRVFPLVICTNGNDILPNGKRILTLG